METDNFNLERFVTAQEEVYPIALKELQEGRKRSHWMWFIFPQLSGLGFSRRAKLYGISGKDEASAYLENPILGQRLRMFSEAILNFPTNNLVEVLGKIDTIKLRSSMTLFDMVSPDDIFARVLDKYYNGQRDNLTIDRINNPLNH